MSLESQLLVVSVLVTGPFVQFAMESLVLMAW